MNRSFGHVQLPAGLPVRGLREVLVRVLRRHRDRDLLPRVLPTLQRPHALPLRPLAQPGVGVAQRRQVRHRLVRDQLADERGQVRVLLPGQHPGRLHQVRVVADGGRELRRRQHPRTARVGPQGRLLQPVEDPLGDRPGLHHLPRLRRPPPLELRTLQQPDRRIRRDRVEAALHGGPVVGRPVRGDLGDRDRAVPGEPRRRLLARRDPAGQHDLERPLPQRDPAARRRRWRQVLVDQAVQPVARASRAPPARRSSRRGVRRYSARGGVESGAGRGARRAHRGRR